MSTSGGRRAERRRKPRLPSEGRLRCDLLLAGGRYRFVVDDLSRGGMKVRSAETALYGSVDVGQAVTVLAVGNGLNALEEERFGEIVWTGLVGDRFLAGIRFVDPLAEMDLLLPYLSEQ
ncbi:PilZ domain-containing protein [Desulfovibrio aminophilus]|uniref:PilZ domain-containing protein n=1 Tax=Desulfovibrio aminophilus TaxID=81425 RepID=UPI003398630D